MLSAMVQPTNHADTSKDHTHVLAVAQLQTAGAV